MTAHSTGQGPTSGGIHVGEVSGDVSFRALGDIIGGDKVVNISTTIQISVDAVTQQPLVTTSPYRGLERFEDRDTDLYFGRDQLVRSLLTQLGSSNVLVVLGPSGSGKSSVVRAGLIPALGRLLNRRFRSFTLVPDVNPFESLRSSLQRDFSQSETRDLVDPSPGALPKIIRAFQRDDEQWLLFIDQFEELFTRTGERLRHRLIEELFLLVQQPAGAIKLVVAMRADFLDRFSAFAEFAKLVEKHITLVTDMHADELRLVIEQPAARHGVVFEKGLVEEIIKDVQGQPGSLPLLQYSLDLLWEEERRSGGLADRRLNTQVYRELGGVRGALQKRADEIFSTLGDTSDPKRPSAKQEIVRRIFLRLVDIAGVGADDAVWRPVRRRVAMASFGQPQEEELLQLLINQKLLVSNREGTEATVEVAHEALFTSWLRLKKWIEGARQVIFVGNRLADDASRWWRRQQENDANADEELISGTRLSQALDMQVRGDFVTVVGGLTETETQFLAASEALRERRAQEERERQQRELIQAQALAAEQKQRADEQARAALRQRRLALGVVTVAALAMIAAVGAWIQSRKALENQREARRQLAEANWLVGNEARGPGFATSDVSPIKATHYLLRAAAALQSAGEVGFTRDALLAARQSGAPIVATVLQRDFIDDATPGAIYAPNGKSIVTWDREKTVRFWNAADLEPLKISLQHANSVSSATFSPDGQRLLTLSGSAADGDTGGLWDTSNGQPLGEPMRHKEGANATFSRDGQYILTWDSDGMVRRWRAADGQLVGEPIRHGITTGGAERTTEPVSGAAFGSDGKWIITWSDDWGEKKPGRIRLWRILGDKMEEMPQKISGSVVAVWADRNGDHLLTAPNAGQDQDQEDSLQHLSLPSANPIGRPIKWQGPVLGAQVSPDGEFIVVMSRRGSVLFNGDGRQIAELIVERDLLIQGSAFSPTGDRLLLWMSGLSSEHRGEVRLYDTRDGQTIPGVISHERTIVGASFSPDGQRVLTRSVDGTARVWTVARPQRVDTQALSETWKYFVQILSHRQSVFVLRPEGIRLMDAHGGKQLPVTPGHDVSGLRISGDGRRILVLTENYVGRLIDTSDATLMSRVIKMDEKEVGDEFMLDAVFTGDSRRIITWNNRGAIALWNANDGSPIGSPLRLNSHFVGAVLSPDSSLLVTGDVLPGKVKLELWSPTSGKRAGADLILDQAPAQVVFSPDGRNLLAWDRNAIRDSITMWRMPGGSRVESTITHGRMLLGVAFSLDSTRILTWGGDGIVRTWSSKSTKPIGPPLQHGAAAVVRSAIFSRNGTRVLSWTSDGEARLWGCDNGQHIATFRQPGGVATATFDSSETRILTANFHGEVQQWDISVDETVTIPERILEFEVRSATTLGSDGQVRVLSSAEWVAKKAELATRQKARGTK